MFVCLHISYPKLHINLCLYPVLSLSVAGRILILVFTGHTELCKCLKFKENILGQQQLPLLHFQADGLEHGNGELVPQADVRWLQYSSSAHFPHSTSAGTNVADLKPETNRKTHSERSIQITIT
jgi:hypothetical protein